MAIAPRFLIAAGLFVRTVLYSFRFAAGFDLDRTVFVTVQEKSLFATLGTPDADPMAVGLARRYAITR